MESFKKHSTVFHKCLKALVMMRQLVYYGLSHNTVTNLVALFMLFLLPSVLKAQCVSPSVTLSRTFPTCTGTTPNNNGIITLTAATNATHFGISSASPSNGTYDGPTTIATATAIGSLPQVIKNNIPNSGAFYVIRFFNGSDICYTDTTYSMSPVLCDNTCATQSANYLNVYMNTASNDLTFTGDGGHIFDNGGSGNYANGVTRTVTLCANEGKVLLRFLELNILSGDVLTIYDGNSTAGTVLGTYTNASSVSGLPQIESSGTCLTLQSVTDASGSAAGWKIEYSTGDLSIPTCFGGNTRVRSSLIQPNSGITILDNVNAAGNAPVCIVYFDENKNVIKNGLAMCVDGPLNTATYGHSYYYGQIVFALDTLAPADFSPLQTARVLWLFDNTATVGLDLSNTGDARTMQLAVWGILGQSAGGGCNTVCQQAVAAVTSVPAEPIITMAGCSTAVAGQAINYQLTTNTTSLKLIPSDSGALPTLCGTNPVSTYISNDTLYIGGSGTQVINLCMTRSAATSLTLTAEALSGVNLSKLSIYHPCDPSVQRFFDVETSPRPYAIACGEWCQQPVAVTISQTASTCTGSTANNNGKITLTAISNADKYGISSGGTYTGVAYAAAMAIGTLPYDLQTSVPNTGGTYTIRFFNGGDVCFKDTTITVTAVPIPNTPSVSSSVSNNCPAVTVNLSAISDALNPSVSGGVFEWHTTNSPSSLLVNTPSSVGVGTYYLFEKSPNSCYSNSQPVQVQIQTCCPSPLCIPITITRAN